MKNYIWSFFHSETIKKRLMIYVSLIVTFLCSISLYTFYSAHSFLSQIENMYNVSALAEELEVIITEIDQNLLRYLDTQNQNYLDKQISLNSALINKNKTISKKRSYNDIKIKLRNISYLIEEYQYLTKNAIKSKQNKKLDEYIFYYEKSKKMENYIKLSINKLNNLQFDKNILSYIDIKNELLGLRIINIFLLIIVVLISISYSTWITYSITKPIEILSESVVKITQGEFDFEDIKINSKDELEVLSQAFNKMKNSIKNYIIKLQKQVEIEKKLIESEKLAEKARLEALQAQINPHFLYNTLNAGLQLANFEDAEKTGDFLYNLSQFFRYSLKGNKSFITIRDEITSVKNYAYLLKLRFEDILSVEYQIDESLTNNLIPPLTLQPIVENAFFHGINNKEDGGIITIKLRKHNNKIELSVEDTGIGMDKETLFDLINNNGSEKSDGHGIGLNNVLQRFQLSCKNSYYEVNSQIDKGTKITLFIEENGDDLIV